MHISDEGLVAGSVNRAELAAAYESATDEAVRANLAAVGADNGMYVEDGKLIDPSTAEPEPEPDEEPDGSEAPPRSGAGSGRDAWATYAESLGVEVVDDMSRDDIIAACEEE